MSSYEQAPDRTGWWIASLVVLVIASLGLMDVKNIAYSGLIATGATDVTQVQAGSPAEQVGFQVGDRIVNNAGIDAEDLYALFRQPRPTIGETRHYEIEREGADQPIQAALTFIPLPPTLKALTFGAAMIGLAFLLCGVGAYLRFPNARHRLLAFLGVAGMNAFVAMPYIPVR